MKHHLSLTSTVSAIGLSIFTIALALAQPSYAQDTFGQNPNASPPATKHWHHRQHDRQPLDQRLNSLKSALQIQPNQERAWQAYASAEEKGQANRKALWQQHKQSSQSLTLPQRIDRREEAAQQMLTDRQCTVHSNNFTDH